MKLFGIELIPWQVSLLQQWGLLPGGKSAGSNVHDRTKKSEPIQTIVGEDEQGIYYYEGVHGPETVHFDGSEKVRDRTKINTSKLVFDEAIPDVDGSPPAEGTCGYGCHSFDGSENDPYRQYPPLISQEAWNAALNPEPAQQSPKALTYPLELPPEFESRFLAPPVDDATTQRAIDYIKCGYGQPYKWPGYDTEYDPAQARGLFQFQPGTFAKLDKLLVGVDPMTTTETRHDSTAWVTEAIDTANLRKRNRNQRTALRQLNKAMVTARYRLDLRSDLIANLRNKAALDDELHQREVNQLKEQIEAQQSQLDRIIREADETEAALVQRNSDILAQNDELERKVRKLKRHNKILRRMLDSSDGE